MNMEIKEVLLSEIKGSLCRMRLEKDYEQEEMLASIGECGVMNPVKLKKVKDGYLLFAGHRRFESAKILNSKRIRAEIWSDIPDSEAVLMGFVENINRKDFTILEEGYAYSKLIKEYGYTPDNLVKPCGKSRARIYQLVKLVKNLTPAMKAAILTGKMTTGHAEWLFKVEDEKLREELFQRILAGELHLKDLKYDIYRMKPDSEKNKEELLLDVVEDAYEKDPAVKSLWRKKVVMHRGRKGNKITINFSGPMELLDLYEILGAPLKKARKRFRDVIERNVKIP